MTTVDALKRLYVANGGNAEDVENLSRNDELVSALAYLKEGGVSVSAMAAETELWGYTISQLQTSVSVSGTNITGTLEYISEGSLADVWGAGHFIALVFTPAAHTVKAEVAILPTEGSGWQWLDADHGAVFKVTSKTQKIYVRAYDANGYTITTAFDLSNLTLGPDDAQPAAASGQKKAARSK